MAYAGYSVPFRKILGKPSAGRIWECVQYYKAVSREYRRLSGRIWQIYWTQRSSIILIKQCVTFDRVPAFEPGGRRFESVRARTNTTF